jgi:hypothetical protein
MKAICEPMMMTAPATRASAWHRDDQDDYPGDGEHPEYELEDPEERTIGRANVLMGETHAAETVAGEVEQARSHGHGNDRSSRHRDEAGSKPAAREPGPAGEMGGEEEEEDAERRGAEHLPERRQPKRERGLGGEDERGTERR